VIVFWCSKFFSLIISGWRNRAHIVCYFENSPFTNWLMIQSNDEPKASGIILTPAYTSKEVLNVWSRWITFPVSFLCLEWKLASRNECTNFNYFVNAIQEEVRWRGILICERDLWYGPVDSRTLDNRGAEKTPCWLNSSPLLQKTCKVYILRDQAAS